jgi:Ca2+-transporting ATPase
MGARASSLAFQSLTIAQLLHALGCRSEKHTLLDKETPPPNKYLNVALASSLVLQVLTIFLSPLRRILGITPMSLTDTAIIAGSALLPLAVNETSKKVSR